MFLLSSSRSSCVLLLSLLSFPLLADAASPTGPRISAEQLQREHGIKRIITGDGTQIFEGYGGGWSTTPGAQVGPFLASNGPAGALLLQTFESSADPRSLQEKLDDGNGRANDLNTIRMRHREQLKYTSFYPLGNGMDMVVGHMIVAH